MPVSEIIFKIETAWFLTGASSITLAMKRFDTGDRVRIDIPDETDPDYQRLHDTRGTVVEILEDDAEAVTGDSREGYLFRIKLDDGETVDVRWRDLRPA